jgi:uncharacterized protein GlcG (DUF336 family)
MVGLLWRAGLNNFRRPNQLARTRVQWNFSTIATANKQCQTPNYEYFGFLSPEKFNGISPDYLEGGKRVVLMDLPVFAPKTSFSLIKTAPCSRNCTWVRLPSQPSPEFLGKLPGHRIGGTMKTTAIFCAALVICSLSATFGVASAQTSNSKDTKLRDTSCGHLPKYAELKAAIEKAAAEETSGLNNQMWATIVDRDGVVCAVAFSGVNRGAQWPGSRAISAQKANTANAFSLDASSSSNGSGQAAGLALSTANLFSAVQPGGSLYGLQASNPVDTKVAYQWPPVLFGTSHDPMTHNIVGGVNVFGGGLALYAEGHKIIGAVGVSGDTSCADHNIAWRVRHILNLDHMAEGNGLKAVPGPASLFAGDTTHPDNIIFDITPNPAGGAGVSKSGFGHPSCINTAGSDALPAVQP